MPDFDIDQLKKAWQDQPLNDKYNHSEILSMLNKKSIHYIKYIFWISLAEFLVLGILGIYFTQFSHSESLVEILTKIGMADDPEFLKNLGVFFGIIKLTNWLITGYFVYLFYKRYSEIHVESNLKQFITKIIGFKKTVNTFIYVNIILFLSFTLLLVLYIYYAFHEQQNTIQEVNSTILAFSIVISLLFCLLLIWVYYKLVYGIFLKKLNKNLEKLKEIEGLE